MQKWDDQFTQLPTKRDTEPLIARRPDPGRCVVCDEITDRWLLPAQGYVCGPGCAAAWEGLTWLAALD